MKIFLRFFVVAALAGLIVPAAARARCGPDLVSAPRAFRAVPVKSAPPARISIEWFGHSFFRLVSPGGTRVIADPFGPEMGLRLPAVRPHAVTVGREHPHHSLAGVAAGNPLVLRGLGGGGESGRKSGRRWGTFSYTMSL